MTNHTKKILIIASTHGHERIGLKIIQELEKLNIDKKFLDFEIGNPMASAKNVPFIESDLNRAFPGKEQGTYEEMRANELSKKIREADIVIDIHSTNTTDLGDESMLIVTSYNEETKEVINTINPPKVLYMKYKGDNALISQARIGVAFEYGKDSSINVLNAILYDIAKVLIHYGFLRENPYSTNKSITNTKVFEVYDVFKKDFEGGYKLSPGLRNFETVESGAVICDTEKGGQILAKEDFVPILFGENRYTEILGFKGRIL